MLRPKTSKLRIAQKQRTPVKGDKGQSRMYLVKGIVQKELAGGGKK